MVEDILYICLGIFLLCVPVITFSCSMHLIITSIKDRKMYSKSLTFYSIFIGIFGLFGTLIVILLYIYAITT